MIKISLDDIQRDLAGCLQRVQAGETLLILQADQPVAELRPVVPRTRQPRPAGLCAGEFRLSDDFNAPLPDGILKQFEGT